MKNIIYTLLLILSAWMIPDKASAQLDPTLTGMILVYTDKAKSQYKSQIGMMGAETEGHVWLKSEVEATKNYQKQFDTYISTFRGILSYAAQTYGFYHEVNRLCDNMGKLSGHNVSSLNAPAGTRFQSLPAQQGVTVEPTSYQPNRMPLFRQQ